MKLFKLAFLGLFLSLPAFADDLRQCTVTFTNSVAGTTASVVSADGGGSCDWSVGATVVMQCDVAVYYNAAKNSTGGATTATAFDFKVDFTINPDPFRIDLAGNAKHVSVLGVTSSGQCKFGPFRAKKL